MSLSLPAWRLLNDQVRKVVWDRFYSEFSFRPSTAPEDWPSIHEPVPSVTWDISAAWDDPDPLLRPTNATTNSAFLSAFLLTVVEGSSLLVLDWQHPCYEFFPHRVQGASPPVEWPIPIIPAGDYNIFLSPDLRFGLFGHPWESTVCIFGATLLAAVEPLLPPSFCRVVRRDGLAA